MYLRLFKRLAVAWLLISISYIPPLSATEKEFEISYFPEVVFKETPLTVHLRAPEAKLVDLLVNKEVNSVVDGGGSVVRELTLTPKMGLDLSFHLEGGEQEWSFKVLEPGFSGELYEEDGFLYQGGIPVILMPQHRLPPPLDRRWETVELLEHMIQNERPEISSMRLYLPEESALPAYLKSLFPQARMHFQFPDPKAWFRVHGYLTPHVDGHVQFLVVEMDLFDFERGMSPQTWFMKWQFLLQNLEKKCGYADGLLLSPAYTPETLKWKPVLDVKLKGLASAHGLRFIDRSYETRIWQERLQNQLGKVYKLP